MKRCNRFEKSTTARSTTNRSTFALSTPLFAAYLLVFLLPSAAQEVSYVSSITAQPTRDSVRISWEAPETTPEHYVILRSPAPINNDTYPEKTTVIAEVPAKTTSYTATPPDNAPYFYAVLSADSEGAVRPLFIPHRNVTARAVALNSSGKSEQANILSLRADAQEDRISIHVEAEEPQRPILIYRSTSPIRSADDLLQASLIATIGEGKTTYADFPLAGVEYYYAAIDARRAEAGSYRFESGVNSLSKAVTLPISDPQEGSSSPPAAFASDESPRSRGSVPLPFLQINRSILSGEPLAPSSPLDGKKRRSISAAIEETVERLLKSLPEPQQPLLTPTVLPEDRDTPRGSDDQKLKHIIEGPFSREEWQSAEKRLGQLLSTRIGEAVQRRAHFYLGQTFYFQERYTEAFFEFILLEDSNYETVRPWLYRILELKDETISAAPQTQSRSSGQ